MRQLNRVAQAGFERMWPDLAVWVNQNAANEAATPQLPPTRPIRAAGRDVPCRTAWLGCVGGRHVGCVVSDIALCWTSDDRTVLGKSLLRIGMREVCFNKRAVARFASTNHRIKGQLVDTRERWQ